MLNNKYGSTGGGREDLAQAGLEYENNLDDLSINIKKYISEIVSSKEN
jgi:alanyl-tRNA synthetase